MRKQTVLILSIALIILSCGRKSNKTFVSIGSNRIPEDTVPFEYKHKLIVFNGIYEDSIHLNFIFDTGWVGLSISDSLKSHNGKENRQQSIKKVKIGNLEYTWNDMYYLASNHRLFTGFDKTHGAFDWKIFENKIIKISYYNKYISILDNINDLHDYDSIKINKENDIRLGIPITVDVQGKKIKEYVLLDTGFNGMIDFNDDITEKYDIRNKTGREGKWGYPVKADTIRLGIYYLLGENRTVGFMKKNGGRRAPFAGIIGNRILENFDVILDLKNYYLYLKPIEE